MLFAEIGRMRRGNRSAGMNRAKVARRKLQIQLLEKRVVLASNPLISEFLAANSGGLRDSDGDSSDWIELYNPTAQPINLQGWSLTDSVADINQWQFPSVELAPSSFLTVFASGKNRTSSELHTNFRLAASGEYLALVNPSGTIVSEFTPGFPNQVTNVSYGIGFDTDNLIEVGAATQVRIPTQSIGSTWTTPEYVAAGWINGTTGVGFGVVQPGFNVTYVKSNTSVDDIDVARDVLVNEALQTQKVTTTAPVVNYLGNGGGANFENDAPFPTQNIGDDYNDFVIQSSGTVMIPAAGSWTFGVNSDDGFALRLERNGIVFQSEFGGQRGPSDTLATFDFPTAGDWSVSVIMFERGGGASVEMFAAQGSFSNFSSEFRLVGDAVNGGLAVFSTVGGGSDVIVGTNVEANMRNVNASAYIRVPFTVSDPATYDSLILKMRYDDGFVAYLNGVEVARRNAPLSVAFNSSATVDRNLLEAVLPETINLTSQMNLLRAGNNVLAIQGLNSSASDDSFLVLPELVGFGVHPEQQRYFADPSPNAPNENPLLGIVDKVSVSLPAGFYSTPAQVSLNVPTAGAQIRYTLDGSEPTLDNSILYIGPLTVSATTTLRSRAFRTEYYSLPSVTATYLYLDDVIRQSPSDDVAGGYPDFGAPPAGWPESWGSNVVDYGMDQTVVDQVGSEALKNALRAIPTLSITTDLDNLFDPARGIYANAYQDGLDWERPASFELINPDGTAGFQINAGLRIRGGYSRSGDNPKHSFRLFFRSEYGESNLNYPLFGTEGTDSFKKIDLRTSQNYSWSFGGDPSNSFIQDLFARESQRDMGQSYTRSRWYHLYIGGQYWGIFQTQERAEAEYAASYFGGVASNYDVIKPEAGPYAIYATDGDLNAYQQLWEAATTKDLSTPAEYYRLQGKNAQGLDDPLIPNEDVLLDVDNLIVYMIGVLQGGNLDAPISWFLGNQGVNNFFAVRDRTGREGFRYFQHDAEHTLRNINEDRNGPFSAGESFDRFNPQYLHQRLMANKDYLMRFADTVQKVFFQDGPMTVAKSQARATSIASPLDQAILAESARWGDSKRPNSPLGRQDWLNAVNDVVNGFLANRNPVVLDQWRGNGLLPLLTTPKMFINGVEQYSGQVVAGSELRFDAASSVYYTTDGSDPRIVNGVINPNASIFVPGTQQQSLVGTSSTWKYFDKGVDLGTEWRTNTFNDGAWDSGNAELGYGDGDETTTISFGPNAANKYITSYFRKSFNVTDSRLVTGLTLRLKRDDGAVVYINGVEAARSNMPAGAVTAATLASLPVNGPDEARYFDFVLSPSLLQNGTNVIAVEIHQNDVASADVSFDAELVANVLNQLPISINSSTRILARAKNGEDWSPIIEALYSTAVPASASNLAITEVHFNPVAFDGGTAPPLNDKENFEFIELRNVGSEAIRLSGVRFVNGITFDFSTGTVPFLNPGQSVVVAKNPQAFEARYGANVLVAGFYTGNLSNGGEQVVLVDEANNPIDDFTYDDDPTTLPPWPTTADGGGFSLTVKDLTGNYSDPGNWRASYLLHGTPGYEENDYPTQISLSNSTVAENTPNTPVGVLSALDPNAGDRIVYSILPEGDGAEFRLLGDELRVGPVGLDFESGETRSVTIRATDSGGLFIDQTFVISILDVFEPFVVGTTGDDLFELAFISTDLVSVKLNNVSLGAINSSQLTVDGRGGNDTLRILGTANADAFILRDDGVQLNAILFNWIRVEQFTLNGLAGTDTLQIQGTNGNDAIAFQVGSATLNGQLFGLLGLEQISLNANAGDDTITISTFTGIVSLRGGADTDSISYGGINQAVLVDLGNKQTRLLASGPDQNRFVDEFETVVGTVFSDRIIGSSNPETFRGGAGNDVLIGAGGDDILRGEAGDDQYVFVVDASLGSDTIDESPASLGAGNDTIDFTGSVAGVVLNLANQGVLQVVDSNLSLLIVAGSAFERVLGSEANDVLNGDSLNNTIIGNGGNDSLNGGQGSDTLSGGLGNDTYFFSPTNTSESDVITESTSQGTDTVDFGAITTDVIFTLASSSIQTVHTNRSIRLSSGTTVERLLGGDGNDTLTGNTLDNLLNGRAGNDILAGATGNDTMSGGFGDDAYRFAIATAGTEADTISELGSQGTDTIDFGTIVTDVSLNLASSSVQNVHLNRTLKLNSTGTFENAIGGNGNDQLQGNGLNNSLNGRGGNDTLTGLTGSDTLTGGLGDDVYKFATASTSGEADSAFEFANEGTDTIDFSSMATGINFSLGSLSTQNVHLNRTLKLNGSAAFENLVGGNGNDTLIGNALNNTLTGRGGNDSITGAGGNDSMFGGLGDDAFRFAAATGAGETDFAIEYANQGTDTIDFASLTTDVAFNLGSASVQSVHANRTLTLNGGAAFENAIGGSGNDSLLGNALNNTLTGRDGNDTLTGGAGNDSIAGGLGDDTYRFGPASSTGEADLLTEFTTQGIDTIDFGTLMTSVTFNLGSVSVQNVSTNRTISLNGGTAFENVIGGSSNDVLTGNSLANTLTGRSGNDTLDGSTGNDSLAGGLGDDTYRFSSATSAGEADAAIEYSGQGTDTIDFGSLAIDVSLNLGSIAIQNVHANRTLQLNGGAAFENAIGGSGNDSLTGNSLNNQIIGNGGNDIAVGQDGNDTLQGNDGRDMLIGGLGLDTLNAGSGDDILIAGRTTSDYVLPNLQTMRTTWVSANTYAARIAALRAGVGSPVVSLRAKSNVLNDTSPGDSMTGGIGDDWYFQAVDDAITDFAAGELVDLL